MAGLRSAEEVSMKEKRFDEALTKVAEDEVNPQMLSDEDEGHEETEEAGGDRPEAVRPCWRTREPMLALMQRAIWGALFLYGVARLALMGVEADYRQAATRSVRHSSSE